MIVWAFDRSHDQTERRLTYTATVLLAGSPSSIPVDCNAHLASLATVVNAHFIDQRWTTRADLSAAVSLCLYVATARCLSSLCNHRPRHLRLRATSTTCNWCSTYKLNRWQYFNSVGWLCFTTVLYHGDKIAEPHSGAGWCSSMPEKMRFLSWALSDEPLVDVDGIRC